MSPQVRIPEYEGDVTNSFDEALSEYADFLEGFVSHQVRSRYMQVYVSRLLAFTPHGTPPMDPRPPPIETETEQQRRLMQYADSMQRTREAVRRQRERIREEGGAAEAIRSAEAHRTRGDAAIGSDRREEALGAYSMAVAELAGMEADARAAWALVLAKSSRSQALLLLRRHEEVLEDATDAHVLLERHGERFDPLESARVAEELGGREAESGRAIEAQQHRARRAELEAERRRARKERRRRARDAARASAPAPAPAPAAATPEAGEEEAISAAMAAAHVAAEEPEGECSICFMVATADEPLEDVCGHGHPLHAGCASLWRAQCVRLQQQDPEKDRGPHCPTCRRPI